MKADDLSQIRLGFDSHRGPSAPRRGFSLLCGGALMVLLGLMGGCVTEHSGGTQMSLTLTLRWISVGRSPGNILA